VSGIASQLGFIVSLFMIGTFECDGLVKICSCTDSSLNLRLRVKALPLRSASILTPSMPDIPAVDPLRAEQLLESAPADFTVTAIVLMVAMSCFSFE
jgi:hypothetical protein